VYNVLAEVEVISYADHIEGVMWISLSYKLQQLYLNHSLFKEPFLVPDDLQS